MYQGQIRNVKLLPSLAQEKEQKNVRYLMDLKNENLLFSYYTEAGLNGIFNYTPTGQHGGWDNPLSHIRGTFTGHWLSAAARIYQETGDMQLKAKADYIVQEIGRCQETNGGEWAFSIPEKYLYALKRGQHFWAPQYVCHKTMMGLLDMYQFAGNQQALEIVLRCADWFLRFTDDISRENMSDMMDAEETGGMMEFWADLYALTGEEKHKLLMERYERPRLFEQIYNKIDVLTNLHANATIPEIHGCARAYEVTGEERYRRIVENYWELAVTERGCFATGGQTSGEVWTPLGKQSARLGDRNQEHCTVYNMIRLADYLFRWSGDVKYADYIERNIENGILAQTFWEAYESPDFGVVTYYLPLAAGSEKVWGSKTGDFWCCHCTAVQSNARYREFIYYQSENNLTVAQYQPSVLETEFLSVPVKVSVKDADLVGECVKIKSTSREVPERPDYNMTEITVDAENPVVYPVRFRMPWWLMGKMEIFVNGESFAYREQDGFAVVEREWSHDTVLVKMPKGITCCPLADEPDTVAFLYGPTVLAGVVDEERTLHGDINHPETMLKPHNERLWAYWLPAFKTVGQPSGFYMKPIKDIGKEKYTVYFPVEKKKTGC